MPSSKYRFPEGAVDVAREVGPAAVHDAGRRRAVGEVIHRTTAMFVEYFGEGARPFTMVLVDEVADGGWGRADSRTPTA